MIQSFEAPESCPPTHILTPTTTLSIYVNNIHMQNPQSRNRPPSAEGHGYFPLVRFFLFKFILIAIYIILISLTAHMILFYIFLTWAFRSNFIPYDPNGQTKNIWTERVFEHFLLYFKWTAINDNDYAAFVLLPYDTPSLEMSLLIRII